MPRKPSEFWKAVVYFPGGRMEKIYSGKSGRKRAMEFVGIARRKNPDVYRTKVLACIPSWSLHMEWEA